jgi:TRAP-type C4-dicarboxylate transport system permease small subunit
MEAALDRLLSVAAAISRMTAWIAGLILTLAALAISFDISIRYFANATIGIGNELAAYALSFASAWGITFTLLNRAHVRIDSLYVHLPSRARALLDIVGLLAFISFMSLVVYYGYFVLEQSIISKTVSVSSLEIPLAIPQFFWFVGLVFFMLVAVLLLLRAILAFIRGDLRKVHDIIGARSMNEDIDAERESMAGRRGTADVMKGTAS